MCSSNNISNVCGTKTKTSRKFKEVAKSEAFFRCFLTLLNENLKHKQRLPHPPLRQF